MTDNPTPEPEHLPVDLTPLAGLRLDPVRADALLARIEAAAAPGLARRATVAPAPVGRSAGRELERVLARFSWPALAAAAAAVVILVVQTGSSTDPTSGSTLASVAQSLTQTDSSTHWIAEQSTPTDADLVWAIGLENGQ